MEIKEQVGVTAGKVWQVLNDSGPQTLAQLKKRLNGSGELVGFALGWLAREDKIDISQEKKNLKVVLK
ncbi:MAG: winged helix-turn-helix domain-containing protein [Terriglobia bacterium]